LKDTAGPCPAPFTLLRPDEVGIKISLAYSKTEAVVFIGGIGAHQRIIVSRSDAPQAQ